MNLVENLMLLDIPVFGDMPILGQIWDKFVLVSNSRLSPSIFGEFKYMFIANRQDAAGCQHHLLSEVLILPASRFELW